MSKRFFVSLSIFLLILLGFFPLVGFARIVPECDGPCGLCDFFLGFKNIFNFVAFSLAPPVAAFLIVVAGVLFLSSGGSEERVKQAKKIFFNVVIGLVIIYVAWLMVDALINVIGKSVEDFTPETWYKFSCQ